MKKQKILVIIIIFLSVGIFTAIYLSESRGRRSISVGPAVSVEKGDLRLTFEPRVIKVNNTDAVNFRFELTNIGNTTHNEFYRWWHFYVKVYNQTDGNEIGRIMETRYEPGLAYELSLRPGESLRENFTWNSRSYFSGLGEYQPGKYLVSGVWWPHLVVEMETPKTTLTITP